MMNGQHSHNRLFVTGNNASGQCGVSYHEDIITTPIEITHFDTNGILKVATSQQQTFVVFANGILMTSGENDNNELCRTGKRSLLARCDCLETFQIIDASIGSNYFTLLNKDGRLISWGCNEMGQLGNETRDNNFKPRVNTTTPEAVLQLSSGQQHNVLLTKGGNVLTYGGNKRGQLGSGQLTSSTVPFLVPSLKHKPVVSVSCGENHTLVLTAGGNVYSWGENAQGQLGLGDTTPRLRPEIIKSLRNIKTTKIATGGGHSLLLASNGLVFSWGSNTHGQCGISDTEVRVQSTPVVVQRLSELRGVDLTCGKAHSVVVCEVHKDQSVQGSQNVIRNRAYVMGLNSSGQLGLGPHSNSSVFTPTALPLSSSHNVLKAFSGPLSMHTLFLTGETHNVQSVLPAVDLEGISEAVEHYKHTHALSVEAANNTNANITNNAVSNSNLSLKALREMIATAFSSISILNASFLTVSTSSSATDHTRLAIDLPAVRASYSAIMSTESITPQVVNTLGRATLQAADQLRQTPVDDVENLSVFLILLENPLMLRAADFHVAIEVVVSCILSLPKYYRSLLFRWLKAYPSEYFGRVLQVLQNFLTYILTTRMTNLDATSVVLVLETLHQCNVEEDILPEHLFYNAAVASRVNLLDEWRKLKEAGPQSQVFNYCDYPFLIDDLNKYRLIQHDFAQTKSVQSYRFVNAHVNRGMTFDASTGQLISPETHPLPVGLLIEADRRMEGVVPILFVQIEVRREHIVGDLVGSLQDIIASDPNTLRLPLRVSFKGELAVDRGGVTKELFTLVIRQLVLETNVLAPTSSARHLWFSKDTRSPLVLAIGDSLYSTEFIIGLVVGLAAFNGVFVDLPLPSFIYKIISGRELSLSDLWDVDPDLARGLQTLLDFDQGGVEEVFGATFSASKNPLLPLVSASENKKSENNTTVNGMTNGSQKASATEVEFVDLIPSGADIPVSRANRSDFVKRFVQYALYLCCKEEIDAYISGLRFLFDGRAVRLCTHIELERILCGSRDIGDLSELRVKTVYKGVFSDEHPVVNWFWDVLSGLSIGHKRKFLQFLTGSERIPLGGIANLGLVIQSTAQSSASLPTAHTCFNILDLPASYNSREQLQNKFLLALENCEGFGIV